MLDLSPILDLQIPPGTKGLPLSAGPVRLGDIGSLGWELHRDLQLPAAVLRSSALWSNAAWMQLFLGNFENVVLCPHGKTTMAPQLFDRQLRDGAWGLSCATMAQLQVYLAFGVKRILYSNEVASISAARWICQQLGQDPGLDLYLFLDSATGAEFLARAADETGIHRPIKVLIEIGSPGVRTGVRSSADALALADQIAQRPQLALAGLATYEGVVQGGDDRGMEPQVGALFEQLVGAAEQIARAKLFSDGRVILSAGGSRFLDMAAASLAAADLEGYAPLIVLRSGCYVSHDAIHYANAFARLLERRVVAPISGRLVNALEVWAEIQSHPEPGWAYATIGKRDISYDLDLPRVIAVTDSAGRARELDPSILKVKRLSDQHAHIQLGASSFLSIGDHIGFGISHPCTTFDKWRILFEVDDADVVVNAIATFF